jgi:hypothetical protein
MLCFKVKSSYTKLVVEILLFFGILNVKAFETMMRPATLKSRRIIKSRTTLQRTQGHQRWHKELANLPPSSVSFPRSFQPFSRTRLFSTLSPMPVNAETIFFPITHEKPKYEDPQYDPPKNENKTTDINNSLVPLEYNNLAPELEIKSKPVEGGNWNIEDPLGWAKHFGRRSNEYEERLQSLIRLQPGDVGYFDVADLPVPPIATVVRTKEQAKIVMEKLMNAPPELYHACDTEVMDIDLKAVGPVGNGYVTCASIYSGPDFDYGLGNGPGTVLWIDNLDDACGILQEFKAWFEDERHAKVWHNYGFDRHVMWNEGIDVKGFGGDTMHLARLEDTSRLTRGGYSLEALTADLTGQRKKPMKEIFGVKRLRKDGSEGLISDIPPVEVMQRDPQFREQWIQYSCLDAKGTWLVREELEKRLRIRQWYRCKDYHDYSLYEYYHWHMRPFGEVLTDMERRGIRVDARSYLASVEVQARKDRAYHSQKFREWAATQIGPDGLALNVASSMQLQTFLFGGAMNKKTKVNSETVRVFKVLREEIPDDALEAYRVRDEAQTKQLNGDGTCRAEKH